MGATYTRQSSSAIVDGAVIEASDINAEFDQILAAFAVTSGHTHDGTTAEGGPITKLLGTAITIGDGTAGTDIAVTFDGETGDGVLTWMEDEDYFQFSDDLLLTTTEKLQFRDTAIYINSSADGQLDLVADTEIQIAATTIDINGAVALNGAITGATNITLSGELDAATLDISGDADIDGTLETDALSINGTTVTSTATELNLVDGITAGTVSASKAVIVDSNKDLTGLRNLTISGDLTVSGDDITMGTNTAGNILVADGTNFNSVAVGGLSEISTVANDDVFLAVDTSGGGLKKITRSAVVSGLATSSAISNVSEDSTPQLGGNLDLNGSDIVTTSNADLELAPNGTGHVTVKGNTNAGAIQFNCESNSHGQILKSQPHSAGVTNVMLLPAGADSTLVSLVSTDTLTNKTLTSPKINENVVVTSTATELNLLDGITAGTVSASLAVIADSNKDISGFRNVTLTGELDAGSLDISGDADIDGTLEADAITINGTTLAETISDTVGAMVGSNTETGIAVTYDDSDNTLDFVISALPLSSIDIDGGTDIGADLTTSDLIVVDDGAGGTNRKAALSRVVTLMTAQGFSTDDPTALAIALG
jgi:cytoskeletal protein CcmA (bactofilin family)